jgi:NAD(P)-dependent dehydrogenase (short-subunit alcohol dehydrogenase family)
MELRGMSAIVSGGGSGLGEAVVRDLASKGVKVAIFDLNQARSSKIADELGALYFCVDVTDADSVAKAILDAERQNGVARILVNCAGIGSMMRTVDRKGQPHDLSVWNRVIGVNLTGSFNCLRLAASRMALSEPINEDGARGVIINTASAAGFEGQIGQIAYSASKGGVIAMTLTAARDLAVCGVRCVTIAPGTFQTPIFDGLPDDFVDHLTEGHLFPHRAGRPDEFAHAVRFACENDQLNGTTIRLDAGLRLTPK